MLNFCFVGRWVNLSFSLYELHFSDIFFSYTHTHRQNNNHHPSHYDILSRTVRCGFKLAEKIFLEEERERESREWNENCFVN